MTISRRETATSRHLIVSDDREDFVDWVIHEARISDARARELWLGLTRHPHFVIREWKMAGGPPYSNDVYTIQIHICHRCDAYEGETWLYGASASRVPLMLDATQLCPKCAGGVER